MIVRGAGKLIGPAQRGGCRLISSPRTLNLTAPLVSPEHSAAVAICTSVTTIARMLDRMTLCQGSPTSLANGPTISIRSLDAAGHISDWAPWP